MQETGKTFDYLIVGQGICGTLLSYYLRKAGKSVLVIDEPRAITASKAASGLMNPVTGKKWVTSWMVGAFLPSAVAAYTELEQQLNVPLIRSYDLLAFHPSNEAAQLFEARIGEDDTYPFNVLNEQAWTPYFQVPFGIGGVSPCYLVEVQDLLARWREQLRRDSALLEESFVWDDCAVGTDGVRYRGMTAEKLICCGGPADIDNPYFTRLPFQLNKGEAIIASIPGLPRTQLYKHGVISIVPWKDDLFWIGSIFDRDYRDELPSAAFRQMVETTLARWLRLPYTITDHIAAIRPATGGQKPFAGLHPLYQSVGIFNGMGSKGCSQAPLLAQQLVAHLLQGAPLTPEADIHRFVRVLSRA